MSSISHRFAELQAKGEKALVCFVTAGDPSIGELPRILKTLEASGADLIEVGIPFSDPIADGPIIQASSQRALDAGVTLDQIFEAVREAKISVPIIYMGYFNMALRRGLKKFAADAKASGASGALLSDLTPDEAADWIEAAKGVGLETVFLTAPTSTDERIRRACEASTGFVYCVSRTGVTGAGTGIPEEVEDLVSRVRKSTQLPVCVGFGVRTGDDVRTICKIADGAVVGSSIVELIHKEGIEKLGEFVRDLKQGTR